jgi:hypothetical protein
MRLKNIALKLPKIGTTAMSIIVENCGHFHTRKIPVLYHKHLLLLNKRSWKYSYTSGISDEPY